MVDSTLLHSVSTCCFLGSNLSDLNINLLFSPCNVSTFPLHLFPWSPIYRHDSLSLSLCVCLPPHLCACSTWFPAQDAMLDILIFPRTLRYVAPPTLFHCNSASRKRLETSWIETYLQRKPALRLPNQPFLCCYPGDARCPLTSKRIR